jgi:hypothetical protein
MPDGLGVARTPPVTWSAAAFELATALHRLCAGRHVGVTELVDDPGVQGLGDELGSGRSRRERELRITDLLRILGDRRLAVCSTAGGPTTPDPTPMAGARPPSMARYTLSRPGESYTALWDRHAARLIAHHPEHYLPGGFRDHVCAALADDQLARYGRIARLALDDARLLVQWYPDGLPDLSGPLGWRARARLRGYVGGLHRRAGEYAACIAEGPHRLRRAVEASRLPCRPDPPGWSGALAGMVQDGADDHPASRSGAGTRDPLLWMPVVQGREINPLYLLAGSIDEVTGRDRRVVGVAALSVAEAGSARVVSPRSTRHRCCPEVGEVALASPTRLIRFHLQATAPPPIPEISRAGVRRRSGARYVRLRPLGWLVPEARWSPGPGYLLWGCRGRALVWEGVGMGLQAAISNGRVWDTATCELIDGTGQVICPAPVDLMQDALARALPYTVTEGLREL